MPRVVALIGASGSVDTTTALTGVFNMNNPRSAATVDGSSFYVSGQGVGRDCTGGVFYATARRHHRHPDQRQHPSQHRHRPPAVGTEARVVEIVNTGSGNQLYVSRDFNPLRHAEFHAPTSAR